MGGLPVKSRSDSLIRLPALPVGSYGRLGGSPFITRPSWGLASLGGGLLSPSGMLRASLFGKHSATGRLRAYAFSCTGSRRRWRLRPRIYILMTFELGRLAAPSAVKKPKRGGKSLCIY